jgi:hypothetical protein
MRKLIGFLLKALLLGLANAVEAASPSFATPITYTEQATATGSLGGVAFTNANLLLTFTSDTANVMLMQSSLPGFFISPSASNCTIVACPIPPGPATVSVGGGPSVTILDFNYLFSVGGGVGFSALLPSGNTPDILDTISASLVGYDLRTSIGPITGLPFSGIGDDVFVTTTGGDFFLTDAGNPTFTAVTIAEPPSLILLSVALAGLGVVRRRLT